MMAADTISYRHQMDLTSLELSSNLYYLSEDVASDSLQKPAVLARFEPLLPSTKAKNGGWVRFTLANPSYERQSVILEIQNTNFFDLIQLFENKGGVLSSLGITGEQVPHHKRPIKDHYFVFPIELAPQSSSTYFLYLNSSFAFKPSIAIHSAQWFAAKNNINRLIYVFHYGFLFFVMTASFLIALIASEQRIFFYYSLYLFCLLLFFVHLTGFGFEFLWPSWSLFDRQIPNFAMNFSMIFLLKFTESFLAIDNQKPWIKKCFKFFFYSFCISVFLNVFTLVDPTYRKIHIIIFFAIVTISFYVFSLFVSLRSYRSGTKHSLLYFIAFVFFFLANIIYVVRTVVSMHGWFGEHILQIGNMFEVIILSVGLAYWFKMQVDEKQKLLFQVHRQQWEMDEEKGRIARDLHDNIGTQLTSLSLGLNRLVTSTSAEPKKIELLYEHANATILELRNTIWVINKKEVTMQELADKISVTFWRLGQQDESITYKLETSNMDANQKLQPTQALNLFRIAQEAINNSLKHSKATKLLVVLETEEKKVSLSLHDNGIGFDMERAQMDEHYGLANMKNRATEIKGSFTVDSQPGVGTRVTVQVSI